MSLVLKAVLGLFVALIFLPQINTIIYIIQAKSRGLSYPPLRFSFPFGIPSTIQSIKALRANRLNKRIFGIFTLYPKGKTIRTQVLGDFVISTANPENVKAILSTQFKDFSLGLRHSIFFDLFGDGIFTLDGHRWQTSRAMLRPQFTREQISHVHTIETHIQHLIRIYKENQKAIDTGSANVDILGVSGPKGRNGEYVDIQPLFLKLTLDTSTKFLFGESVDLLNGGNKRVTTSVEFGDAFNRAQELIKTKSMARMVHWFIGGDEYEKQCKICKDFAMSYVNLALQRTAEKSPSSEKPDSYIFLDELAKEMRYPTVLRDQAINILVAGRDTTASLLSWVFLMLARHKEIFHKLRDSIIQDFGDGSDISIITFESLKSSKYLRHVIDETLRLYPTVPSNSRVATKDTTLPRGGGKNGDKPIFVTKGTTCAYSVYTMHRNPDTWGPDADKFRPERWETPNSGVHSWDYLPFNGGPRICLGQQFALTEASYVIVRLLQSFSDIEADAAMLTPEEPEEYTSLTLSPAKGVFIKLIS